MMGMNRIWIGALVIGGLCSAGASAGTVLEFEGGTAAEAGWQALVQNRTTLDFEYIELNDGDSTEFDGAQYAAEDGSPEFSITDDEMMRVGNPDVGDDDDADFADTDFRAVSEENVFSPHSSHQGEIDLTWNTPMSAVGLWFLDVEDEFAETGITINGEFFSLTSDKGNASKAFFGLVSDTPFNRARLHFSEVGEQNGNNGVGADNVQYAPTATAVPTPAAAGVGLIGFALLALSYRRAGRRETA